MRWCVQLQLEKEVASNVDTNEQAGAAADAKAKAEAKAAQEERKGRVMGFDLDDGTGAGSDSGEDSVHEARPITVRKKKREITDPKPWYATLLSLLHVACVVCGALASPNVRCRKLRQSRIPWYLLDELEAEKLKLRQEKEKPLPFQSRFPATQQVREDEPDPNEFRWGI